MSQPGYNQTHEGMYWWRVALYLDEAQRALANAMVHNLDDQRPVFALQDKLREGQAILLEIFRAKHLLPGSSNGVVPTPVTVPPVADGEPAIAIENAETAAAHDSSLGMASDPVTEGAVVEGTVERIVEDGNGSSNASDDAAAHVDPATPAVPAEASPALPAKPDASA